MAVAFTLLPAFAAAQTDSNATVLDLRSTPESPLSAAYEGSYGAEIGPLDLGYQGLRLRGAVPFHDGRSFRLGLAFGYHLRQYELSTPAVVVEGPSLHRFELTLGGAYALSDRWALRVGLGIIHASNLQGATVDALQPNVIASIAWAPRRDLSFSLGVRVSRQFFEVLPTPVLGVTWRASDSVTMEAMLPRFARIRWRLLNEVELILRGDLEGLVWAIESDGPADDTQVKHLEGSATLGVNVRVFGPVSLFARGGVGFANEVELATDEGANIDDGVGRSFVAQAGLTAEL